MVMFIIRSKTLITIILANIWKYIKIHHDQVGFIPGIKRMASPPPNQCYVTFKKVNVLYLHAKAMRLSQKLQKTTF